VITTIIGGILFQIASILDGCDGEVATLKHKQTKLGAMVDTVSDHLSNIAFIIGVTVGVYRATLDTNVFYVTAFTIVFLVIALKFGLQYISKKGSGSLRDLDQGIAKLNHSEKAWYLRIFGFLHPIGRRDMFSFLAMVVMMFGNIIVFYWALIAMVLIASLGITLSVASMLSWRPIQSLIERFRQVGQGLNDKLAAPDGTLNPEND
jgi:CDP-L-myo-inositol myo-inositolphosphotransferase